MSDYPFEKLTKEIDDLKNQIKATLSVRVDEFREEVVSIKNRIGARLVGLQLGAFAPRSLRKGD